MLTVGSLFAGIGGFDLGLERAGMRSVWQCEIDPYAIRVLEKHWPDVLRVRDVRDVGTGTVPYVDVICGGFPCQDISHAGKRVGITGERSGLWHEYARVIRELRPKYVVVENVSALATRGLDVVLASLAAAGFDAEWTSLRASDFGAPHPRDRLWLVAYPSGGDGTSRDLLVPSNDGRPPIAARGLPSLPGAPGWRPRGFWSTTEPPPRLLDDGIPEGMDGLDARPEARSREGVRVVWRGPDPQTLLDGSAGGQGPISTAEVLRRRMSAGGAGRRRDDESADDVFALSEASGGGVRALRIDGSAPCPSRGRGHHEQRPSEPRDAVRDLPQPPSPQAAPRSQARLAALGNALVPQIAEWIGRRILEHEALTPTQAQPRASETPHAASFPQDAQ